VTFDAPIEMLHDRTMVPVRFFSEQLGCDVYWEPINSLVVISPKDNPWVPERKSEIREEITELKIDTTVMLPKEDVIVKNKGNLIILIMVADETTREKLEEGFDNL